MKTKYYENRVQKNVPVWQKFKRARERSTVFLSDAGPAARHTSTHSARTPRISRPERFIASSERVKRQIITRAIPRARVFRVASRSQPVVPKLSEAPR